MKIVLLNIVINAVEAMELKKGKLRISASKENGKIQLSISDNGCGISEKVMKKIFEPNYSTKPHGLGIGLSNVRTILEKHGVTYYVTSTLNEGTTFTLHFDPLNASINAD